MDASVNADGPRFAQLRLEMLRHGPAHNQLLSPLVPYMVLVGEEPATTQYVGYEHRQLVAHLRALRYTGTADQRVEAERRLQEAVSDVLAKVPALGTTLAQTGARAVHLRLILSARELAMLPFEMANTPAGAAGAGPLLLNPLAPVCVTREVRAVGHAVPAWPQVPRVLMISSEAGGPVPKGAHVRALLDALAPLTGPDVDGPGWKKLLTVLVDPELEQVRMEIARAQQEGRRYTHVHVLAHGGARSEGVETRYGIAMHDPRGAKLIVDGTLLASALSGGEVGGAMPAVVTVCTCDGGDAGDVLEPGAGLAHELHVAGVPWVVASQYPLTKPGSVTLTSAFYAAVLAGVDPREAMIEVRRRLFSERHHDHDWASVVVYARVPADFDDQVQAVAVAAGESAVFRALDWVSRDGGSPTVDARLTRSVAVAQQLAEVAERAFRKTGSLEAKARFIRLARLLGSAAKRRAERQTGLLEAEQATMALRESLAWYRRAYELNLADHWSGGQVVSLSVVLDDDDGDLVDRWSTCVFSARTERRDPALRAWALSDLIELCVLAPALKLRASEHKWAAEQATLLTAQLVRAEGPSALIVRTTVYQLRRYVSPLFATRLAGRSAAGLIAQAADAVLSTFKTFGAEVPNLAAQDDKE